MYTLDSLGRVLSESEWHAGVSTRTDFTYVGLSDAVGQDALNDLQKATGKRPKFTPYNERKLSVKTLRFFATPDEMAAFVDDWQARFNLDLFDKEHRLLTSGEAATTRQRWPTRLYLAPAGSSPEDAILSGVPKDAVPTAAGWVQLDLPRVEDRLLFLGDVSSRSDWWDGQRTRRGIGHSVFNKIVRALKADLQRPVWGRNVAFGGEEPYFDIGYTAGVVEWVHKGGELGDFFAKNVRFSLPAEASE